MNIENILNRVMIGHGAKWNLIKIDNYYLLLKMVSGDWKMCDSKVYENDVKQLLTDRVGINAQFENGTFVLRSDIKPGDSYYYNNIQSQIFTAIQNLDDTFAIISEKCMVQYGLYRLSQSELNNRFYRDNVTIIRK